MRHLVHGAGNVAGMVLIGLVGTSMLAPAFQEAQQKAQAKACSQNVKQLVLGIIMYEQDKGRFPAGRMFLNSSDTQGVITDLVKWSNAIAPYMHADPEAITSMGKKADKMPGKALATLAPGDREELFPDIYRCPSVAHWDMAGTNSSYGYNHQYLGDSTPLSLQRDGEKGFFNYPVSKASIMRPDRTVVVADSEGTGWKGYQSAKAEPSGPKLDCQGAYGYLLDPTFFPLRKSKSGQSFVSPAAGAVRVSEEGKLVLEANPTHQAYRSLVSGRHQGAASVAFLDGHVESVSMMELYFSRTANAEGEGNAIYPSNATWNGSGKDNDENGDGRVDPKTEKLVDPNEAFANADGTLRAEILPFYNPKAEPAGLSKVTGLAGSYATFGPGFDPEKLCDRKTANTVGPTLPRKGPFDFSWIR